MSYIIRWIDTNIRIFDNIFNIILTQWPMSPRVFCLIKKNCSMKIEFLLFNLIYYRYIFTICRANQMKKIISFIFFFSHYSILMSTRNSLNIDTFSFKNQEQWLNLSLNQLNSNGSCLHCYVLFIISIISTCCVVIVIAIVLLL